jgi:hypothetical protein
MRKKLGNATGVTTVCLHRHCRERRFHMPRLEQDHFMARG